MSNPMFALLDATAREGQNFCVNFFKQVDAREAPTSILPSTTVVWNGNPLAGVQAFNNMVQKSPNMVHELSGLDVHPFPNGDTAAINMMVTTSGKVKLGITDNENNFAFSAQLVIRRPQPNSPLILQTMAYRLVHKPTNATLEF